VPFPRRRHQRRPVEVLVVVVLEFLRRPGRQQGLDRGDLARDRRMDERRLPRRVLRVDGSSRPREEPADHRGMPACSGSHERRQAVAVRFQVCPPVEQELDHPQVAE
jgi:hypothetical protein